MLETLKKYLKNIMESKNSKESVYHKETDTSFPHSIGALKQTSTINHDELIQGQGLQIGYALENQATITIYIYTLCEIDIKDTSHKMFNYARISSIFEIHSRFNSEGIPVLQIGSEEFNIEGKTKVVNVVRDAFVYKNPDDVICKTEVFNWVSRGHFFKIRASSDPNFPDALSELHNEIIEIIKITSE